MMVENLTLLILLVPVPLGAVIWLAFKKQRDMSSLLSHTFFTVSLILFLSLWGQYGLVASHYFRPVLWLALFLAVILSWRRPFSKHPSRSYWSRVLVGLGAITLSSSFMVLSYQAWQGRTTELAAIDLVFPLKDGRWFIGSGGDSLVINLHFRPQTPFQHYAIDVHKLNWLGAANKRPVVGKNEDHAIFGTRLLSPCSGNILAAVDGVPDNAAGEYYAGEQGSGNHVFIQCQDVEVGLVHLQAGSIEVQQGDVVAEGTPIGRVGNSGFSTEPHLHLQTLRTTEDGQKVSVPMRFQGRFLVRNDVLSN